MKLSKLQSISKKRILISGSVVAVALAVVIGATGAFFSDEESSIGNIFTAGAIDLKIDNESYAIDCTIPGLEQCEGVLVASPGTSWELTDLTDELFFNFFDLKPGDYGEDTISIHVDNDAWLCMDWTITDRGENGLNEPEAEDGDITENEGELQNFINFVWWVDDGDNVLEEDEDPSAIFSGTLEEMDGLSVALADSSDDSVFPGPIPGSTDPEEASYIGKAWCFGDLTLNALPQNSDEGPLQRGTGILCDGSNVNNTPQTDSVVGDLTFRAVQARNNPDFTCEPDENGEDPGNIIVQKIADGAEDEGFEFTPDYDSPFVLQDGGSNDSGPLEPGEYSVEETDLPEGWVLDSAVCNDDDGSDPASIILDPGETVTCVFTNVQEQPETGVLTLLKTVVDADDINVPADTDWTLSAIGPDSISGVEGDASITAAVVLAGDYTLTEVADTVNAQGYPADPFSIVCSGDGGVLVLAGGDTVTVAPDDNVTCTFTNDELAG